MIWKKKLREDVLPIIEKPASRETIKRSFRDHCSQFGRCLNYSKKGSNFWSLLSSTNLPIQSAE